MAARHDSFFRTRSRGIAAVGLALASLGACRKSAVTSNDRVEAASVASAAPVSAVAVAVIAELATSLKAQASLTDAAPALGDGDVALITDSIRGGLAAAKHQDSNDLTVLMLDVAASALQGVSRISVGDPAQRLRIAARIVAALLASLSGREANLPDASAADGLSAKGVAIERLVSGALQNVVSMGVPDASVKGGLLALATAAVAALPRAGLGLADGVAFGDGLRAAAQGAVGGVGQLSDATVAGLGATAAAGSTDTAIETKGILAGAVAGAMVASLASLATVDQAALIAGVESLSLGATVALAGFTTKLSDLPALAQSVTAGETGAVGTAVGVRAMGMSGMALAVASVTAGSTSALPQMALLLPTLDIDAFENTLTGIVQGPASMLGTVPGIAPADIPGQLAASAKGAIEALAKASAAQGVGLVRVPTMVQAIANSAAGAVTLVHLTAFDPVGAMTDVVSAVAWSSTTALTWVAAGNSDFNAASAVAGAGAVVHGATAAVGTLIQLGVIPGARLPALATAASNSAMSAFSYLNIRDLDKVDPKTITAAVAAGSVAAIGELAPIAGLDPTAVSKQVTAAAIAPFLVPAYDATKVPSAPGVPSAHADASGWNQQPSYATPGDSGGHGNK